MTQPTKPYNAIVLSETHWDRAWYLPFQVYRVRLVRLIDRLIEMLDSTPEFHSFMLDGQMSPIEDYLAIRPKAKADLQRLVKAGKLFVGPWYILADEFLVSPESLIRNLQIGLRQAADYGVIMREGYTPDSFGHISQLPQILQGFNIDSCIFWRGFGDEADTLGNEFHWDAPDGSRVLGVHIRDGYHNIANVGYPNRGSDRSAMALDTELAMDQMRAAVDLLKGGAQTSQMLLFDGVDHAEANLDITGIIAKANELFDDVHIEHGTLPDYIANVRKELAKAGTLLPSISGEFNRGKYAHVLQSVYSTRIYLKQANERGQRLLERYAEPMSAFAWALGGEYPQALLTEAWKLLLLNHPHDDICGCSCDEVHQEDMQRFSEVDQIGRILTRDSSRQVMAQIKRDAQDGIPIVLFNPAGWARNETLEIEIPFDQNDEVTKFELISGEGNTIPYQITGKRDYFEAELRKNHYQTLYKVALTLPLPAAGYRVIYAQIAPKNVLARDLREEMKVPKGTMLTVEQAQSTTLAPPIQEKLNKKYWKSPLSYVPVTVTSRGMENSVLKVDINFDGTLNITDKATNRTYRNLLYFEDVEDSGDEYDYSPCPNSQTLTTQGGVCEIRPIHTGKHQVTYEIKRHFALPSSLTDDRQNRSTTMIPCKIVSQVTLRGNNRHVDVTTTVDNLVKDHRLRVCFPTQLATDVATADGHFDVITRPIDKPAHPEWVQPPVPTHNQRAFVDVSDGEAGLAIFNRGLPEYEIMRDNGRNTVALTLLRCVDMLFRDDLLTRPGYAWLPLHTPDAQCLGTHTFEYAIAPHAGDWKQVYRPAHTWAQPVYMRRGDETEGFIPRQSVPKEKEAFTLFKDTVVLSDLDGALPENQSFLSVNHDLVLMSAVKRSEDGKLLVVRLVNLDDGVVSAELKSAFPIKAAYILNFNETIQSSIAVDKPNRLTVQINSKQALTLGLEIERMTTKLPRRIG
ncbi:MAG: alpha-mannosidase [Candidatus Promineifilaceae bacterium]